jgi:acyl dehydratase
MADWGRQRRWPDVRPGMQLPPIAFPLSLYRLVMAAGATRDYNSIHHNSDYARATGAPEAYANTMFLQGMWERAAREFIGLDGRLLAIRDFRMRTFCPAGSIVTVRGEVQRTWTDGCEGFVELAMRSQIASETVVGPGAIMATLPLR